MPGEDGALPKEEEPMRKLLISAAVAGTALIGLAGSASASDLHFGLSIGAWAPAPVYVAPPPPVEYYYPAPTYASPIMVAPGPRYVYPGYRVVYGRPWHGHWRHEHEG